MRGKKSQGDNEEAGNLNLQYDMTASESYTVPSSEASCYSPLRLSLLVYNSQYRFDLGLIIFSG